MLPLKSLIFGDKFDNYAQLETQFTFKLGNHAKCDAVKLETNTKTVELNVDGA